MAAFTKRSLSGLVGSSHDWKRLPVDYKGGRLCSITKIYREVKMEEEVSDVLLSVASLELPDHARAALVLLMELMYPVCSIHNMEFRDMIGYH